MSALGPATSLWAIELGVVNTLETWLEQSLSLQDQTFFGSDLILPRPPEPGLQLLDNDGNDPGDPTSIHGGIDTLTDEFYLMPEIIVMVQPVGQVTYFGSGDYSAEYDLTIAAQISDESELRARAFAQMYGAAIDQTILQNGSLGGVANRTRLLTPAKTEFVDTDADDAYLVQSVSTFTVYVDSIVNDSAGLAAPVAGDTLANPDSSIVPPSAPTADDVEIAIAVVGDAEDTDHAQF
jgi:hypothetical protein